MANRDRNFDFLIEQNIETVNLDFLVGREVMPVIDREGNIVAISNGFDGPAMNLSGLRMAKLLNRASMLISPIML